MFIKNISIILLTSPTINNKHKILINPKRRKGFLISVLNNCVKIKLNIINILFKEKNKHFPCILKKKIRNINIDHISQLLNNIKTSRKRENNFMKIFDTNPKSSSNSRTQSKSNTSRDKSWKKDFLIFNSSRNYNKKCSLKKIWKKQIFNLTHEK